MSIVFFRGGSIQETSLSALPCLNGRENAAAPALIGDDKQDTEVKEETSARVYRWHCMQERLLK